MIDQHFIEQIAEEVHATPKQVAAAVACFNKGAGIPFVARYRKDLTGGLSESKLERIAERNEYLGTLVTRREAFLSNIEKQGKLSEELRTAFLQCGDHLRLEDLNLPFKKQRYNRAAIAAARGLIPLADYIWAQSSTSPPPVVYAESFVNPEKQVLSVEEALEGARDILAECIAMNADLRGIVRAFLTESRLTATATKAHPEKASRYAAYAAFCRPLKTISELQLLEIFRGDREGMLRVELQEDGERILDQLSSRFIQDPQGPYTEEIRTAVFDAYKRLMRPVIEEEVLVQARRNAEEILIHACREQVKGMLLAPPAGAVRVVGAHTSHAGQRAFAILDEHGAPLETRNISGESPESLESQTQELLAGWLQTRAPTAIAVGNGPGGRDLLRALQQMLRNSGDRIIPAVLVHDVGLNTFLHSRDAQADLPDLEPAVRAAVSIGRRYQDPLMELLRMDLLLLANGRAAALVNRRRLQAGIARTIESVVNRLGVDLNAAPLHVLRYVNGIQLGAAQAIIEERARREAGFTSRAQLLDISGIGEKTYQQCAGFLRIHGGDNPLDDSSIHPETYETVERIAAAANVPPQELFGNADKARALDLNSLADEKTGMLTLEDLRFELGRIGRESRRRFRPPLLLHSLRTIEDLAEGMVLEGQITNITEFGMFVNIGIPQEGLVHRSEVGRIHGNDGHRPPQAGDVARVLVTRVEKENGKISLSLKGARDLPLTRDRLQRHRRDWAPEEHGRGRDQEARPQERRRDRGSAFGSDTRVRRPQEQGGSRRRGKGVHIPKVDASSGPRNSGEGLLNTALADQLAALRNKIMSNK